MEHLRIAALNPSIPALESRTFKAAVTLIWPYSSSARQFAALLAEPDFRLRRKKGQVRVRFSGSSARALATTGVGIGDEIVLSLKGARFVQDDMVNTPGKSIDWELEFGQTVVATVYRGGNVLASLDLDDVPPTPAPQSPVRREPLATPSLASQWSSPAFLRRSRLSDGPFFQAPYDPLADADEDRHDAKRRRRSYRDWKAWTYNARTPSPDKDDDAEEQELLEMSPIRPSQLPGTPISPPRAAEAPDSTPRRRKKAKGTVSGLPQTEEIHMISSSPEAEEVSSDPVVPEKEGFVRDADYYELYAGPNEVPPAEARQSIGGDTEEDTVENTEEDTEPNTEDEEAHAERQDTMEVDMEEEESAAAQRNFAVPQIETTHTEEHIVSAPAQDEPESDDLEVADKPRVVVEEQQTAEVLIEIPSSPPAPLVSDGFTVHGTPATTMAPPTLSALTTEFAVPPQAGLLTPIGKEPASPTLRPLDSATLPLPSPFPGERDINIGSYLDHVSTSLDQIGNNFNNVQTEEELHQELPNDASYIMETSFFSSINTTHESAFTPVRFTFGMDGAGMSRPLQISSDAAVPDEESWASKREAEEAEDEQAKAESDENEDEDMSVVEDVELPATIPETPDVEHVATEHSRSDDIEAIQPQPAAIHEPEVIELSSGSETDTSTGSDESEVEEEDQIEEEATREDESMEEVDAPRVHEEIEESSEDEQEDLARESRHNVEEIASQSRLPLAPNVDQQLDEADVEESEMRSDASLRQLEIVSQVADTVQETPVNDEDETGPDQSQPTHHRNFSDLINISSSPELTSPTKASAPELGSTAARHEEAHTSPVEQIAQHVSFDNHIEHVPEEVMMEEPEDVVMREQHAPDHHPDIKVESIEEVHVSQVQQEQVQPRDEDHLDPALRESHEMEIEVPGEHDKLGEMHTMIVPDTSPARNTRSKTILSSSPARDDHGSQQTISARRSQTTRASAARSTISPLKTRTRSTVSPSRIISPTSPRSLRSHSKLLSPMQQKTMDHPPIVVDDESQQEQSESGPTDANLGKESATEKESQAEGSFTGRTLRSAGPVEPIPTPQQQKRKTGRMVTRSASREPSAQLLNKDVGDQVESGSEIGSTIVVRRAEDKLSLSPQVGPSAVDSHSPLEPIEESDSVAKHSIVDGNQPITPDATQLSHMELQESFKFPQQQDSAMLTPQDTQREIEETQPTQANGDAEVMSSEHPSQVDAAASQPKDTSKLPPATHTTSPDFEMPSIGLSTPLAYYTPLKDLIFFLNRSSQFHSDANPDILALVTSSTTPAEKAKKGPKHWNTTLKITDASIYPATTTVNLFRAYQAALPHADVGDVILLRSVAVKSIRRQPMLISADESAWCIWRYGKPVWGTKKGKFGEVRAREEVKGPEVERGEGEWREVERLRGWFAAKIKSELDQKTVSHVRTRSKDVGVEGDGEGESADEPEQSQVATQSEGQSQAQEENKGETKRMTRSQGKTLQP